MSETNGKEIVMENVACIERVVLPFPEKGGVVVLRGLNGTGKTSALDTLQNAITKRGRFNIRRGAEGASFQGLGLSIHCQRSTRRKGELEVLALEGKLSIDELVDPGLKDLEAAD